MFSRRSLFVALGLALPLVATTGAEAATTGATRRRRAGKPHAAAKPRRQRRAEAETTQPAKG